MEYYSCFIGGKYEKDIGINNDINDWFKFWMYISTSYKYTHKERENNWDKGYE